MSDNTERRIEQAMWAGDIETLQVLAHCICCCAEHTFTTGCPAYVWGGCRGQCTITPEEIDGWARHYEKHHAMPREQFYGRAS